MDRLRHAIAAGRLAVAQREMQALRSRALLAIGLREGMLLKLARAFLSDSLSRPGRVLLIADQLPTALVSEDRLVFEHLPVLADLLVAGTPAEAQEHRRRRLGLIFARWSVKECMWVGAESADLVEIATAGTDAEAFGAVFRRHEAPIEVETEDRGA